MGIRARERALRAAALVAAVLALSGPAERSREAGTPPPPSLEGSTFRTSVGVGVRIRAPALAASPLGVDFSDAHPSPAPRGR